MLLFQQLFITAVLPLQHSCCVVCLNYWLFSNASHLVSCNGTLRALSLLARNQQWQIL